MNASLTTAIGVFDERSEAMAAIEALKKDAFRDDQIGIASKDLSRHFEGMSAHEQQTAGDGAVSGSLIGTGVGAVAGLVGAALIPGVLPLVAGSLLVSAIVGGAAGAALGAFAGPFVALGFSVEEANEHARHLEEGKTVVLVYSPDRHDDAQSVMIDNGAYDNSMNTSPR